MLLIFLPLIHVGTGAFTYQYYPSQYKLLGQTKYVAGSVSDLVTNNGVYMTFASYLNQSGPTSNQSLYAHQEQTTIAGTPYYLLNRSSSDKTGTTLSVSVGSTGMKTFGSFVYSLQGVSSISASTWTVYYRAYTGGGTVQAFIAIYVMMSNGTTRTTISTGAAYSANLPTSWSTLSGAAYSFPGYTVVDQTDYLKIDFGAQVYIKAGGKSAYLRIDDNSLDVSLQTRINNVYLPSTFQQVMQVEFSGIASTAYTWTQLNWTIDSAWNISSVPVTLQLFNYTAGVYPTSGSGYISYTSSATANTDETKTQTITTRASDFRNSTGGWKLKITGAKWVSSPSPSFSFKADFVQLSVMPLHDVAVLSVTTSRSYATPGQIVNINVVVKNKGTESENVTVTAYRDTTAIGTQTVLNLGGNQNYTLTFVWNTTGVAPSNYQIKAVATPVPGEPAANQADNTFIDGYVTIYKKPSVSIIPSNVTGPPPNVNQYFSVNITITNAHDLYAWQAGMTFNASVLQAVNFTEGPFLKDWATANSQTTLWVPGTINNSTGVITSHGCTLTGAIAGASGNGTLAKVWFKVIASGTSNLNLTSVILTDALVTAMPATINHGFFKLPAVGPPIASFTFSPPTPSVGQTVTFDASSSSPGGGTIVSYKWNFGDSNITTVAVPIILHVYSSAGDKTVVLNVTNSLGLWNTTSKIVPVIVGYALNLRVMDFDNATAIQGAYVYKDSAVKASDVNGWANWTLVSGTVAIKVKYYGAWVYGILSLTVNSDTTRYLKCNIFDIQVTTIENLQSAWLQYANVTVYNGTSTPSNKITTGITGANGVVSLLNVPNSTLTFTVYDGATPKHVIANVTRTITTENQAETITCTQNAVSTTLNAAIVEARVADIVSPPILLIGFTFTSSINGLKERIKTVRSKPNRNKNKKGKGGVRET